MSRFPSQKTPLNCPFFLRLDLDILPLPLLRSRRWRSWLAHRHCGLLLAWGLPRSFGALRIHLRPEAVPAHCRCVAGGKAIFACDTGPVELRGCQWRGKLGVGVTLHTLLVSVRLSIENRNFSVSVAGALGAI